MYSTLLDRAPEIAWSEFDWDPSGTDRSFAVSLRVMKLEAEFLDLCGKADLRKVELVLRMENRWSSLLKTANLQYHCGEELGAKHSFLGWALIRVHW